MCKLRNATEGNSKIDQVGKPRNTTEGNSKCLNNVDTDGLKKKPKNDKDRRYFREKVPMESSQILQELQNDPLYHKPPLQPLKLVKMMNLNKYCDS